VQDEEVRGDRPEHDGRKQRGSNTPRPRHYDQYRSGELEDARDVPKPLSKANCGEERDHHAARCDSFAPGLPELARSSKSTTASR
jgi:hypothetical protein